MEAQHRPQPRRHTLERQAKLLELVGRYGLWHGAHNVYARELRVSAATVSRDMAAIRPLITYCPSCGRPHLPGRNATR